MRKAYPPRFSEFPAAASGRGRRPGGLRPSPRALLAALLAGGAPTERVTFGQATNSFSPAAPTVQERLADMRLEDLLQVEVTSVTRTSGWWAESPAAIHVVTAEDIRRNGALSVPEALRQVPGLEVARVDSGGYAISSRGMNDRYNRQLLVLIDGRSVYSLLTSGVAWESLDVMMEDIDRIEVIRGPGATLFGANAVSGVINILTKSARQTQGLLVTAGGGSEVLGAGGLRYGGRLATNAYYRVYGTYFNRDASTLTTGQTGGGGTAPTNPGGGGGPGGGTGGPGTGGNPSSTGPTPGQDPGAFVGPHPTPSLRDDPENSLENFLGGARVDWEASQSDTLTFQGDYFAQTYRYPLSSYAANRNRAGNVLQRWDHTFSDTSALRTQVYYDHLDRNTGPFHEVRHTGDIDAQHSFAVGERQRFLWGLGYRVTADTVAASTAAPQSTYFDPASTSRQTWSAFAQDEITLVENRWKVTLGSKLERNDFTGFEVQPGVRSLFTPAEAHVLWGAVSRAVRTPSREEFDLLDRGKNSVTIGNPDLGSESLIAYEVGYRFVPRPQLSFDLALFYNAFDRMRTMETVATVQGLNYVSSRNNGYGETYGTEFSATWRPLDSWRLTGSYTFTEVQLHLRSGAVNPGFEAVEGNTPQHQFQVHSYLNLPAHFEFDQGLYYVGSLPNQGIDGYARYDIGLSWRPSPRFEARVSFQNLLSPRHFEFGGGSTAVERSVFGQLILHF